MPRHLFLPDVGLVEAYADEPVYTKLQDDGTRISAASQPRIVAMMLEQLAIKPGDRVLEIGAATGYNAALMATLTGPTGHVTTIDIDDDLVTGAHDHLAAKSTACCGGIEPGKPYTPVTSPKRPPCTTKPRSSPPTAAYPT